MKITDELRARILKVHLSDPEVSRATLAQRFQTSAETIAGILGPKPKPTPKPERPGPILTAECACGWTFTGPRSRAIYQRREHYSKHPPGTPKARTTMRRAS